MRVTGMHHPHQARTSWRVFWGGLKGSQKETTNLEVLPESNNITRQFSEYAFHPLLRLLAGTTRDISVAPVAPCACANLIGTCLLHCSTKRSVGDAGATLLTNPLIKFPAEPPPRACRGCPHLAKSRDLRISPTGDQELQVIWLYLVAC